MLTQEITEINSISRIELLNAARAGLDAEAEAKELEVGPDAYQEAFNDAYCSECDAISFQRPKTEREIGIMLRALDFHFDLLMNGGPETKNEDARQARGEKVERILKAVRGGHALERTGPRCRHLVSARDADKERPRPSYPAFPASNRSSRQACHRGNQGWLGL